jgi:abequosyltransferase
MNIKLTVCIPIYNCADFISQALESILPQTFEGIEVIVYDGGSTDGTASLMEFFSEKWPNLHYYRSSVRGGIDADLVTCVSYAKGEYCWLFSGDDVMRPGAILRALKWIEQKNDVYICRHTICSKDMVISHDHPVMIPDLPFTANFGNSNERLEWFRRAVTSEAFFSFISGLIVNREIWQKGNLPNEFAKSCWGHVARFFELAQYELKVCYVAEVWLDQRGDNDSFADKGVVNRYRIGIEGYHKLADSFWGHDSHEALNIRRVIRNEFSLLAMLNTKIKCVRHPADESKDMLNQLAKLNYCDTTLSSIINRLIYFATPYWFLQIAKLGYQPIKKVRHLFNNV